MKNAVCTCQSPPFSYLDFDVTDLGQDPGYGEVSIQRCRKCGARWVKYLIEEEHHAQSGRWWRVPISSEDSLAVTAENALAYVERQEWCFVGGSFHKGGIHILVSPIKVV